MKHFNSIFVIITALLIMNSQVTAQDTYYEFGSLNNSSISIGSDWVKCATGTHVFNKSTNESVIEVQLHSRVRATAINGTGIRFKFRIDDDINADFTNHASLNAVYNQYVDFVSIFAVFQNIPAGSHTVSIWAKALGGTADGVGIDPGG